MKLVTIVRFGKKKKLCISILIYFLKLMRNISKHFLGGGVLLSSIIDINCSAAQRAGGGGRSKSDGCRCEGREFQEILSKFLTLQRP